MPRKRKTRGPLPVPETDAETIFVDDFLNADWPKRGTDDSEEAIFARIEADRARERAEAEQQQ